MTARLHDRIRTALNAKPGLTQKGLAECMGLNPAAVNRMLHGRRNIMAEEIPIIEAYLGEKLTLSPAARREEGAAPPSSSLPPIPVYRLDNGGLEDKNIVDWTQRHPAQGGVRDAFAVYATSNEMEPRYFKGELVYIHPGRPAEPGRDCLVVPEKGNPFLARLVRESGTKIRIVLLNPSREKEIPAKDVRAVYAVTGRG